MRICVSDTIPDWDPNEVVAVFTVRSVLVPYANPEPVMLAPPVAVISPCKVAVDEATPVAAEDVTVGSVARVVVDKMVPVDVPARLTA